MLDRTMRYPGAYFQRPDSTLEEASRSKIDLICRKLHLSKGDHLRKLDPGGAAWPAMPLRPTAVM